MLARERVWQVLKAPLPGVPVVELARAAGGAIARGWLALARPLPTRWRPPTTVMLVWNLVWILLYTGAAGGYAFQAFRTNQDGVRLRALERLETTLEPVWQEIAAGAYRRQPDQTMPVPTGDPRPSLEKLLRSPLVYQAVHIAPDGLVSVLQRARHRDALPVFFSLPTAGRTFDPRRWVPPPDTYERDWPKPIAELVRHERLVFSLLANRDLVKDLGADKFRGVDSRYGFDRFQFKGSRATGYLGFSTWNNGLDREEAKQILAAHGLEGLGYFTTGRIGRDTIGVEVPGWYRSSGLEGWMLEVEREDANAPINREAALVLGLFLLMIAARLTGAALDLRTFWNERALALAQSNFVSAVSHEMRTPLTTIKLYAEMLEQDVVTEPAKRSRYLTTIASESERLGRLIENVLDYARISGHRKALRREPLDIRGPVQEALAALAGPLELAELECELHAPLPVTVAADRDALVQTLINLVGNAIKYAPDGKRILVSVLPNEREVTIAVQDFGRGIPAAEHEKVFKPFYRVGNELTRTNTGSGLGLALVAETAKAHEGRVELESSPGRGSTFRVILPLV